MLDIVLTLLISAACIGLIIGIDTLIVRKAKPDSILQKRFVRTMISYFCGLAIVAVVFHILMQLGMLFA